MMIKLKKKIYIYIYIHPTHQIVQELFQCDLNVTESTLTV